ncbi:MAG: VWA domain-containing protein [Vicinamibacterales bacterium]
MTTSLARVAVLWLFALTSGFQTFRSGVVAVRVDVLVMDGNTPLGGLGAGDFELRDSGVVQRIDSVGLEDVPLNVVLTLDVSASVAGEPLEHLKVAARAAVRLLRPEDRVALVTFNDYVTLGSDWTSDPASVAKAIDATQAAGATALHDAAYTALTLRNPRPARALALLFSDGYDTASWLPGVNVLDIAKRNEVVVYVVEFERGGSHPGYRMDYHSGLQTGVERGSTGQFLPALSEETGGRRMPADRLDRLQDTFVQIIKEFRTRYLLTYTPRGVEGNGWHTIEVKLKGKRGTVVARRGYLK